jgi:hypothetical protein
MVQWTGLEQPITAQDAVAEPLAQRLSFERRPPSPAARAALAQAEQHQPPLLVEDMQRVKAGQRPWWAS